MTGREYKAEDYIGILKDCGVMVTEESKQFANVHEQIGTNMTIINEGQVVAVGGFFPLLGKTSEFWLLIHPRYLNSKSLILMLKKQFNEWIDDNDIVRAQAVCGVVQSVQRRFLEWLGMTYEGTLRKYGPNLEDQVMYARVK